MGHCILNYAYNLLFYSLIYYVVLNLKTCFGLNLIFIYGIYFRTYQIINQWAPYIIHVLVMVYKALFKFICHFKFKYYQFDLVLYYTVTYIVYNAIWSLLSYLFFKYYIFHYKLRLHINLFFYYIINKITTYLLSRDWKVCHVF